LGWLIDDLGRTFGGWIGRDFERAAVDPRGAQKALLRELLRYGRETAFGRDHGFGSIATPQAYREAIPIRDYEGFRPYIDRMIAGEAAVLTTDPPFMFTTTSGTMGKPKLVPVTQRWKRELSRLVRIWLYRAMRDHKGMFRDGMFGLVSPAIEGYTDLGVPIGSVSGMTYQRVPWYLRQSYLVPYPAITIDDYDFRYLLATRYALSRPASSAILPNPSTLLRIAEIANAESEHLIAAIHDGRAGVPKGANLGVSDLAIVGTLEADLRPDPQRAKLLDRARRDAGGTLLMKDAWPNLKMIGCWLGGSCGVQAQRLIPWYGETTFRDIGFRATEATVTVPLSDSVAEGVLALNANFYEFILEDEIEADKPDVYLAHELEVGRTYYIIMTTRGGLYRYDINDVVEVRGHYRLAPLVAFLRKGRDMVNITGEKLHVNHIFAAAQEAAQETGYAWEQVQVLPDVENYRYDLLVEPLAVPGEEETGRFVTAFDEALCRLNMEYAHKRKSRRLHLPRIHVMEGGWAAARRRADVTIRGKRDGQYKWPYILQEWAEESRASIRFSLDLSSDEGTEPGGSGAVD
jgi:hypothetical protein